MNKQETIKQFLAKLKEARANYKPNPELEAKYKEVMAKVVEKIKAKKHSNDKNNSQK